jgi:carnitine 3-dehydrogenase
MSRQCAVVGAGVIGGGWAARLVLNGHDVAVYDPQPSAERTVREILENAERAYKKLGLDLPARRGALRFAGSLAEAVREAELIQESALEREDLKRRILADIDAHAPAEALVCSSTSGLLPTRLQAEMRRPERFVVGHPFNPVYLLPLVELCAGAQTAADTVSRAASFYASLGMKPLHVRKEIDGFIADRLLEALWREALWLVHDDVATVAEIDDAIRFGAGLRWSFMGTFLTYRLAGGEAGMRHFMAQFGPALKLPWTKLMDVPELTPAFIDKIALQSDLQADGAELRQLERRRDDCLVAVMQALKTQDFGAGALLAERERARFAGGSAAAGIDPSQPLRLQSGTVQPDWVDYNNHMTDSRYLYVFGEVSDAVFRLVGADAAYLASGFSYFTVETHIVHRREIAGLAPYYATTQILGADEKRIHVFHRLHHGDTDEVLASGEQMLLHVDTTARRAAPFPAEMARRVTALRDAQAALPLPAEAGRTVGMRPGGKG